jgi:hypothetical protein
VGVADDVRERLRGDAVDRELGGGGQRHLRLGEIELDRHRGQLVGVRANGRQQPEVVENRRPEIVHDAADLTDDVLDLHASA